VRAGAVFPQLEIGTDAGAIRAFAEAVEELGLAHVLAYDHVLGADVARDDPRMARWPASHYTHRDAFHEPLVLFAYLAGVTRALVLEWCGGEEEDLALDDLYRADEAFLTSTTRDVQPIRAVDGTVLPAAPGPVTAKAMEAFAARSAELMDP